MKHRTIISLTDEQHEQIVKLAKARGLSMAAVIRLFIHQGLRSGLK